MWLGLLRASVLLAFVMLPLRAAKAEDPKPPCVAPPVMALQLKEAWKDVLSLKASKDLNSEIKFVQTIGETGVEEINLDFYAITITSAKTAEDFFAEFRQKLPIYLFDKGHSRYFYELRGYDGSNTLRWISNEPLGTVMTFVLAKIHDVWDIEKGSVVVSCIDDTSFVFSTVNTEKDGDHPVSGNRGFGVVKNPDGSVTIFTKGADRVKGSSYFNLGKKSREGIFFAGAKIWEHLIDHLKENFVDDDPRDETRFKTVVPYDTVSLNDTPPADRGGMGSVRQFANLGAGSGAGPSPFAELIHLAADGAGPAVPANNQPANGPAMPSFFPLNGRDAAAFRNGLREFDIVRALYPGGASIALTADLLTRMRAQATTADDQADVAYMAGLHFASVYTDRYTTHLSAEKDKVGIASLGAITAPSIGMSFGRQIEEEGPSLRTVIKRRFNLFALVSTSPSSFATMRNNLALIGQTQELVRNPSAKLRSLLEEAAYAAVQAQIDQLRQQAEGAATAEISKFIAEELDLDPELVKQILALRESFSDKQALKQFEIRNLKDMNNLIFKALLISNRCLCTVGCTVIEMACTAKFYYERIMTWRPNLDDALAWGAETLAASYGYEEAAYLHELAKYAKAVQDAMALYAKFQKTLQGARAAGELRDAVVAIAAIDWAQAANDTLTAYGQAVAGVAEDPTRLIGLREICPVEQPTRGQPGCSLLEAARRFEAESQRAASSLAQMRAELTVIPGIDAALAPVAPLLDQLARLGSDQIRPGVERVYREANALMATPSNFLQTLDIANQIIAPLAEPVTGAIETVQLKAGILADVNERALADADAALLTVFAGAVAPPPAATEITPKAGEAAISYGGLTQELVTLYPSQDGKTILERYNESLSPFKFFRQFPPYFYRRASVLSAADPAFDQLHRDIQRFRAWTTGDPHLQNFGSFLPLNQRTVTSLKDVGPKEDPLKLNSCAGDVRLASEPRIVMNDADDGGEGSPLLDLVRYLVGVELFNEGLVGNQQAALIDAYVGGLTNAGGGLSNVSQKLLDAATGKIVNCKMVSGMTMKRSYVTKSGDKFAKLRSDVRERLELTAADRANAETIIREFFSDEATLLEAYKYRRLKGGSGGNWRWELLVSKGNAHGVKPVPYWIEVKGLAVLPGNYPASHLQYEGSQAELETQARNRYRTSLLMTHQGEDALNSYRLIQTTDGAALVRLRLSGQAFYPIEGMSQADLLEVAKDQLRVLGQIHRKGFVAWNENGAALADQYVASTNLKSATLRDFIERLRDEFKRSYDAVLQQDRAAIARLKALAALSPEQSDLLKALEKVDKARSESEVDEESGGDEAEDAVARFAVVEVNPRPAEADCVEQQAGWTRDDFQFVSLINPTDAAASTEGLEFTKGFQFTFPKVDVPPHGLVVVAATPAAVSSRYRFPAGTVVVGPFGSGKLSKNGERIKLVEQDGHGATREVFDFTYEGDWLGTAEGTTLFNHAAAMDTDELSEKSAWVARNPQTAGPSLHMLQPELVMYRAAPPNPGDNDFVLLANTSSRSLSLSGVAIAGGIDATLSGTLAPGERIAIAANESRFRTRNPTLASKVQTYTGGLNNQNDRFRLTCKAPADPQAIWKVEYQASDWPAAVNGGGEALRAINMCQAGDKTVAAYWNTIQPSAEVSRPTVCPIAEIDLCGGRSVGETWVKHMTSGDATFVCQKNGADVDAGLAPQLVGMACVQGYVKDAGSGECKRN
jgi:hypothetical protein